MQEYDALAAMLNETPISELRNGMRNQSVVGSLDALEILEERWKECAYNLKKWKLLFEYGKMNHDIWLLLDCYGKCNIWEYLCH